MYTCNCIFSQSNNLMVVKLVVNLVANFNFLFKFCVQESYQVGWQAQSSQKKNRNLWSTTKFTIYCSDGYQYWTRLVICDGAEGMLKLVWIHQPPDRRDYRYNTLLWVPGKNWVPMYFFFTHIFLQYESVISEPVHGDVSICSNSFFMPKFIKVIFRNFTN